MCLPRGASGPEETGGGRRPARADTRLQLQHGKHSHLHVSHPWKSLVICSLEETALETVTKLAASSQKGFLFLVMFLSEMCVSKC